MVIRLNDFAWNRKGLTGWTSVYRSLCPAWARQ
jgi:hypothetical protein